MATLPKISVSSEAYKLIDTVVGFYVCPEIRFSCYVLNDILEFINDRLFGRQPYLPTGSSFEGMVNAGDFDTMYEFPLYSVVNTLPSAAPKDKMAVAFHSFRYTHAGYCLLKQPDGNFVSADNMRSRNLDLVKGVKVETATNKVVTQGPSSQFEVTDSVPCLKCDEWPKMAESFLTRPRPISNWPTPDMITDMKKLGCHVVPVAHKQSLHPNAEFRLSFSLPEKYLVRSFNDTQFRCYFMCKEILKKHINPERGDLATTGKVLCSYHLKTAMFWMSETYPADIWKNENIIAILHEVFVEIEKYLEEQSCPNFFLPQNNMMDHLSEEQCQSEIQKLRKLRSDLPGYILQSNAFKSIEDYIPELISQSQPLETQETKKENVFKHASQGSQSTCSSIQLSIVEKLNKMLLQRHFLPVLEKIKEILQGNARTLRRNDFADILLCIERFDSIVDKRAPNSIKNAFKRNIYCSYAYILHNEAYEPENEHRQNNLLQLAENYYRQSCDLADVTMDEGVTGKAYLALYYHLKNENEKAMEIVSAYIDVSGPTSAIDGSRWMLTEKVHLTRTDPMRSAPPPVVQKCEILTELMKRFHWKPTPVDPIVLLLYIALKIEPSSIHIKRIFLGLDIYFKQKFPVLAGVSVPFLDTPEKVYNQLKDILVSKGKLELIETQ